MRIRLSRSIVPNLFTVLNIFFGFLSILFAVQGLYVQAAWYIVLSAGCDALDGFMARLTRSASEFGVELDSLADVVSFGVSPSFLIYSLVLHEFGTFGVLVSTVPLILGALRLARFNVQLVGFSKEHFTGMPIPLSALTLISFVLFFRPEEIMAREQLQYALIALTAVCGILMISTVRYPVIPKLSLRALREQPLRTGVFLAAALAVAVSAGTLLFPVLLLLGLSGPVFATGRQLRRIGRRNRTADDDEEEEDARQNSVSVDSQS
ncbi:MAG: CDP-diacylglycerol--serine O-phosphatidyltransferase [Bacteroidota bacterium]|nr:CDP-diacylglycerol--serine O-phosphatidyltransferase [Bacteroidota bacterium]